MTESNHLGDLDPREFRAALHRAADIAADYLENPARYPVVPRVRPGDVRALFPAAPPAAGQPIDAILDDYRAAVEPNVTHWNHPGFMAYFSITGSAPGVIAELLTASLNVNAMLWRTGPAPTELEELACDWVRQMLDLPPEFRGHINDTASIASMLAIAAARHRAVPDLRSRGLAGRGDVPRLTVYASEHAHSSIDKAVLTLGLGLENLRKIPSDTEFRMRLDALEAAIAEDRRAGAQPIAVVATAGTTSTTSIDPIASIAAAAQREQLWLHVDAAYAGSAAVCPAYRALMPGLERADSIVTNPHKWMFVPVDCSVLLLRDPAALRAAFSLVPDYLRTTESGVTNLMDYGPQLGRRFRALKLWMVIRAFGVNGIRERIRRHCALAREFEAWLRADPGFEVVAPVPFSTVCFRAVAPGAAGEALDAINDRILESVNGDGSVFLSSTRLNGRTTLRLTIGNLKTQRSHVETAWRLLRAARQAHLAPR
ncbi:MAG: amino acid decarboxylase [Phycisphaerales bacterium]|nr:amino acid decarboxylase [Phycisphaerales bacterium]